MRVAMYQELAKEERNSDSATDHSSPNINPRAFDDTNSGNYNLLADQQKNIELFGYDIDLAVTEWRNQYSKGSWQVTSNQDIPDHSQNVRPDINRLIDSQFPSAVTSDKSARQYSTFSPEYVHRGA